MMCSGEITNPNFWQSVTGSVWKRVETRARIPLKAKLTEVTIDVVAGQLTD